MASAKMPSERHDGRPWLPSDASRATLSNCDLPCSFCILFIKGDWMEYALSLGLPTWASKEAP
eukprot:923918-Alexandrium_andersonii.AAC.1